MKTEPRRSMSVALRTADLPAEAIALIKAGTPRSPGRAPEVPAESATVRAEKPEPDPRPGQERNAATLRPAPRESIIPAADGPVSPNAERGLIQNGKTAPAALPVFASVTVRIPSEIPKRLLRAATDRKINQQSPFTQQEIVAQALEHWLENHGY